jgi:uncharacterized protein
VTPVYADHLLMPWVEALPDVDYFDAHTHTGANDPDGYRVSAEQLLEALAVVDARAVVFTMHEPNGYPEANDRVIAEAEASGGRARPERRPGGRGGALSGPRRARDQAAPARRAVHARPP